MIEGMQELVDEFVMENGELVERVVDDVLTLEQSGDQDTIDRIFRCIHSVKGNAGMLGFMDLSSFAHKIEDVFSDVRSGERHVDKPLADVLLACLDRIRDALTAIGDSGEDPGGYEPELSLLKELEAADTSAPSVSTPDAFISDVSSAALAVETATSTPVHTPAFATDPVASESVANVAEAEDQAGSPAKPRPLKALVVEDDFYSRMVLMTLLEKYGECHAAKNGLEAIEAFVASFEDGGRPYDVIFMDVMMPGMDGLTAARTIREIERGKGVQSSAKEARVFMSTALDDDKTVNRAVYECGANKYFVKPLDVHRVRLALDALARE